MRRRTQLVSISEPDPLAVAAVRTRSALLPLIDLTLDRIDATLAAPQPFDLLLEAQQHRTRLGAEPEPLEIPRQHVLVAAVDRAGPASARTAHLERCLNAIQEWLAVGLADACGAAGVNRGTVYAWRSRGSEPRPGTANGILRLHGLLKASVAAVGAEATREWFHAGSPSPFEQLKKAAGDLDAASTVGKELRRMINRPLPPPDRLLAVTLDGSPARPLA